MLKTDTVDRLIYSSGLCAQGTPDEWDTEALTKFANLVYDDIMVVVSAHLLAGDNIYTLFGNLKDIYEQR